MPLANTTPGMSTAMADAFMATKSVDGADKRPGGRLGWDDYSEDEDEDFDFAPPPRLAQCGEESSKKEVESLKEQVESHKRKLTAQKLKTTKADKACTAMYVTNHALRLELAELKGQMVTLKESEKRGSEEHDALLFQFAQLKGMLTNMPIQNDEGHTITLSKAQVDGMEKRVQRRWLDFCQKKLPTPSSLVAPEPAPTAPTASIAPTAPAAAPAAPAAPAAAPSKNASKKRESDAVAEPEKKPKKETKSRAPRTTTAYNFFVKEQTPIVKRIGDFANDHRQFMFEIGRRWREIVGTPAVQVYYEREAQHRKEVMEKLAKESDATKSIVKEPHSEADHRPEESGDSEY